MNRTQSVETANCRSNRRRSKPWRPIHGRRSVVHRNATRRWPIAVCLVLAMAWTVSNSHDVAAQPTTQSENGIQATIDRANRCMVKVFGASAGRVEGYASGFFVSDDGLIMTAQGVFLNGREIRVLDWQGREYKASVIRRDREKQLALLKITESSPHYFDLSNGDVGEQGDWVIAISNAFRVADKDEPLSATLGVISLRTSMEAWLNQRDVAYRGPLVVIDPITSNPGAAGGAVITLDGKLVGMIGKIIESSQTNTRLNYAVPTSVLSDFVNERGTTETVQATPDHPPADLGIVLFRHSGRDGPAYIDRVKRRSPAHRAGFRSDDLVISIGGQTIGNTRDYDKALERLVPGEEVIVVVKRGNELIRKAVVPVEKK